MKAPERGAAIVSALLTVALVAGLSVAAFWQQWRSIEAESANRQRLQAQWLVSGALDWARAQVGEDGVRSPQVDHAGEPWARPVESLSLRAFLQAGPAQAAAEPDAQLSLRLSDAQGRLNVLNLLEGQAVSPVWLPVFGRLFEALALPPEQLQLLAEQLRRANLGTTPEGAQSAGRVPLVPTRQADLGWLGLDPATVQALAPHVSLLPGRLPVNLNTASAPVLQAVTGLEASQVHQLLVRRQAQAFQSLAAVGLKTADEQMMAVNSHFFEAQLELRLPGHPPLHWTEHALLQRDGRNVRTLWQRRVLPEAPLQGAPNATTTPARRP